MSQAAVERNLFLILVAGADNTVVAIKDRFDNRGDFPRAVLGISVKTLYNRLKEYGTPEE